MISVTEKRTSSPRVPLSVHGALLTLFLGFVLLVNAEWLAIDHRPPRWDELANLLLAEIAYHRIITFDWMHLFSSSEYGARPNFVPLLSAVTFLFAGRDYDIAVFLQSSISLIVTSVCLYAIGTRVLDRTAALTAVVIYNTLPAVALWSRYYTLDLPLTAFVTATILLVLVYAEAEADRRNRLAAALGAIVTFGMWAKHLYPIYVFLPIAGLLFFLLSDCNWTVTRFLREHRSLLIMLPIAIACGLAYHVVFNFDSFYDGLLRSFLIGGNVLTQGGYTAPTIRERAAGFFSFILAGSPSALFVIAVGAVAALLRRSKYLMFVWLWLAGALGFFFFILGPTAAYYFHATIPAMALIAAAWAAGSRARHPTVRMGVVIAQTAAAALLAIFLTGNYLNSSLGTFSPLAVARHAPSLFSSKAPVEINPVATSEYWRTEYVDGNIATLPYPHVWPVDPALNALRIAIEKQLPGRKFTIGLGTNYEWFNGDAFNYRRKHLGMYETFSLAVPIPPTASSPEALLNDFDFLILKTGAILKHDYRGIKWADDAQDFYDRLTGDDYKVLRSAGWRPIGKWPLPDRSEASAWVSPALSVIRLPDYFESGVRSVREPGYIARWTGKIGGISRRGIFMHPRPGEPISALTWRNLTIPESTSELAFGIAFDPAVCDKPVSPVQYEINVVADNRTYPLFNRVLEAKPCDQLRWDDFRVSLAPWRGKTIDLTLSTRPALPPDVLYSHAVWGDLEVR